VTRLLLLIVITIILGGPESIPTALLVSFLVKRAPGAGAILLRAPGLFGLV